LDVVGTEVTGEMTSTAGATRLAAYVCSLALVFGLAWAAGRFVPHVQAAAGPEPEATRPAPDHDSATGTDGLASVAAGYRLAVADPTFLPGAPGELRFTVLDPDGRPVTAFAATAGDPSPLHAVVVRRDAAGFQRLDPTMDGDGTWRIPLTLPAPGVWRAYVAMTPTAGPALVLGADLFAPGPFTPFTFPASRTAQIGDFQLRLDGDLVPGTSSQVFATISRDGVAVTDLQPYLGAFGSLVALREGDLAYTAAVPGNGANPAPTDRAGPAIAFTANVPSAGTYRLFLQFRVADVMHTAEFTVPTRNP
jgi:hypothetical protein